MGLTGLRPAHSLRAIVKTAWDYTTLADAYLKRPDYAEAAIDQLLELAAVGEGSDAADIGAGVAHLTLRLAARGLNVTAVEPNDAMRANGIERTKGIAHVKWVEGIGESTGLADASFDLVTFGSSFNVTDRPKALEETRRILRPRGWFGCMWNHRDLEDPTQKRIEALIKDALPAYGYGTRREDQAPIIEASGLFEDVQHFEARVLHQQSADDCIEAWRSHATLERQAGDKFPAIVASIERYVRELKTDPIHIPYDTRVWAARLR